MSESWPDRFEKAGLLERAGLLGGGAVRLLANAIDKGLDRAAAIAVDAKQAFDRELDPNMTDARVLEEWDDRADNPADDA
ncbi:hypothetical protein [Rubrivirga marina]|uniref:Uncharacterized protein n=1 Tax=Rubrivirga marina TaxID=1196024 RepID=A0A271J0P0_9BACT|nr:hypothetical protein [Rubrivirga marina]PAP76930.1 hypothetical protein BSZ37_11055 [Rubrivirga marina]